MPHSLHSTLIPDRCASTEGGLYEAVQRMTEEMPVTRFKSDGVFIIEQLCEHCSLSPSRLLSEVFFPMMSTATKGKSAIAISSLVKQEAFRKEVLAGSTVSTTDLVTFALKHYEPPVSSASTSKYLFIETVLRTVDTLLRENESLKVDFNAILDDLKSLNWYHAFVILSLFFHDAFRVGVSIKFPWRDELSACNTVETFCEIPLILTSWPGDNSKLFESFIIENFGMDDADMLSRSMLLALDRSGGRLDDFLPIFSSAIQKLRNEERDWERFLLEEEFKYQDVPHAQVFDCTGISFGFFDDDNQGVRNWLNTGASPDQPVEIVGKAASLRVSSLGSVNGPRQNFSAIASSLLDVSEFSSVFLEESPRISSTAPDMYMLSKSDSCVLNTTEASKEKPCERLVGIKNSCISRPGGVCDDVKPPETIDAEQCMATMLNEICKEFGEYCATSTLVRIADGEVSHEVDLNISAITSGSDEVGDDSLLQTIPSGSRDSLLNSQQSFAGMNGADVESADEKTCTNLSSDWDEVVSLKEEPAREHVLLELRTFTWALDTIEEWDECPVSVRTKVLRLALESRCSVIKKRAQQLRGSDMED
ncbi:hypothetical protein ANCCAN_28316 [Ancylostoma caninum]|uniref:Uncharacterized protein n=1 Tax=Ancylostoma caninum TaxID=29170 RepID=A0A368F710_ANCCA|nr:hypothetical protein ANCCAN_28316 [Ancylostoma caninum]